MWSRGDTHTSPPRAVETTSPYTGPSQVSAGTVLASAPPSLWLPKSPSPCSKSTRHNCAHFLSQHPQFPSPKDRPQKEGKTARTPGGSWQQGLPKAGLVLPQLLHPPSLPLHHDCIPGPPAAAVPPTLWLGSDHRARGDGTEVSK